MAKTQHQLGTLAYEQGQLGEAKRWYQKSLTIREGIGDRSGVAASQHQLGMLAQDLGQLKDAERWYQKSLTISEDLGHPNRVNRDSPETVEASS
jgi:tetratricopeptide (TPR) repeat protein